MEQTYSPQTLSKALKQAVANQQCQQDFSANSSANSSITNLATNMATRIPANKVNEMPIEQVLAEIALNKTVIFVDTREPEEYRQSHIPGAVNIPMRELNAEIYAKLKKADRVISYCIKDFRGYEVARKLLKNGIERVAVMVPYGLSGWQMLGLPVTTKQSEDKAKKQLLDCALAHQASQLTKSTLQKNYQQKNIEQRHSACLASTS